MTFSEPLLFQNQQFRMKKHIMDKKNQLKISLTIENKLNCVEIEMFNT